MSKEYYPGTKEQWTELLAAQERLESAFTSIYPDIVGLDIRVWSKSEGLEFASCMAFPENMGE